MDLTAEFGVEVAVSVGGAALLFLIGRAASRWRLRPVKRFWRAFCGDVVIMSTEYELLQPPETLGDTAEGERRAGARPDGIAFASDGDIAATATSGYFLSYGMYSSLALLTAHCERTLRARVRVIGDKGHSQPRQGGSLIVLGSPANNHYLQKFWGEFGRTYPVLERFSWRVTPKGVALSLPTGEELSPDVDAMETGLDYALIASFPIGHGNRSRLLLIAGCNMWGTEAACRFLLEPSTIARVPDLSSDTDHAVGIVIRARISNGQPDHIDIHRRDDGAYLYDLRGG